MTRTAPTREQLDLLLASLSRHGHAEAADILRAGLQAAAATAAGLQRRSHQQADTLARVRTVLPFAEEVMATSGPGPASAVQAVLDRLVAALDTPETTP